MLINNKINWFPGHMKKATDEIINKLKQIDIVIEIVDSRSINFSSNQDLIKIINNKLHLKIALKSDLADLKTINKKDNILIGNIKNKLFRKEILNTLDKLIFEKKQKLINKGLKKPKFLILVLGLPNVGKSSFINFLKEKNILEARNVPGLTKKQRIVKIKEDYELIDTPGILVKKIDKEEVAKTLCLLNCIKKEVINIEEVIYFGINYIFKNYTKEFLEYYKINEFIDFYFFCEELAKRHGFLVKNNEIDFNRLYNKLFSDISESKICKINFEI